MTTIAEENIIKKRLLIEGDSGNEDKLINKLTKSFIKWASCVQSEGDEADETCDALFEQMQISLSHAEFGLLRNHLIYDMNQMEQNNYKVIELIHFVLRFYVIELLVVLKQVLYETINNDIDKAEKKIVEKKVELQEARKIRKNRQEYDLLARRIHEYPDRLQMQETIRNLEERMKNIKKTDAEYDKKIELRHKQFSVVLQSVSSLKSLIESDINPSDLINTGIYFN
jgi:THO complex subunit 7